MCLCVCVCVRVQLRSVPLVWTGPAQQQVEAPLQACYLLLNKSAAGDRTQSADGQRARVMTRGLLLPPVAAELRGGEEGGGG